MGPIQKLEDVYYNRVTSTAWRQLSIRTSDIASHIKHDAKGLPSDRIFFLFGALVELESEWNKLGLECQGVSGDLILSR